MINVTQTYLPPLEEYVGCLLQTWDTSQVTNHGPLAKELGPWAGFSLATYVPRRTPARILKMLEFFPAQGTQNVGQRDCC